MRQEFPESRQYTPRGITFMDALNLSISRSVSAETKISSNWVKTRNNVCNNWSICTNSSKHKGGRLWLIWQPSQFLVDVRCISAQIIYTLVCDKLRGITFWFTLVYGFNKEQERAGLWTELNQISRGVDSAWMICGDFNSLMNINEKIRGAPVSWNDVLSMRQMVMNCNLVEMKTVGAFFTWNNKHENGTKVYSKLDRVLINADWLTNFPECYANFLPEGLFDHCPCLIKFTDDMPRKRPSLKYFNMWSLVKEFEGIVQNSWYKDIQGTPMYKVVTKLKMLKKGLRELNNKNFSDIENITRVTEISLKEFQTQLTQDPLNKGLCDAEAACAKELMLLKKAREQYLLQKSKEKWMSEGDDNTAYYHASIKQRRVRNKVYQIKDMNGKLCIKAPGPDGYSSQFFKDSWATVGAGVSAAVRSVIHYGKLLKECNTTTITMVPKIDAPENVTQFRPMAYCNTIYKCVAKVLCNRLSTIMPIISPSQSAFVKGRDIVGNILLTQDLVKMYKRKACSPRLLMKIDLQKAYDSVEWSFLQEMLTALGFPNHLVGLLMQCVSTPTYSIALNGEVFGFFQGKRGLRQGDPLSTLLFTICLEYLSRILEWVQQKPDFRFHPFCKRVQLSHLCFADDLIMFCRGDKNSVVLLLRAFKCFSNAFGLCMNQNKSSMYTNGVDARTMIMLERVSGMRRGTIPFKYLGVTITPKRLGVEDCHCLTERISARIQGLGARKLSYAGRVVLIKSVLSTLHNYWARIFILPKTIITKIQAQCRKFLWHGNDSTTRPALVAWSQDWLDYKPGVGASWAWKKICGVKEAMKPLLLMQGTGTYTIKLGYDWLLKMNIIHENECYLCGDEAEFIDHPFFQCEFSKRCLLMVEQWR
ncbi:uncharacterized protein LOC141628964 [Silene latifolia]|uniref:uncharacterized protein LOC141628964 n=1 Tax=Silene latifolia TaxID=37657 RepID=UPI003D786803